MKHRKITMPILALLVSLYSNAAQSFTLSSSPGVGHSPYSVIAADVNGDGQMDLITANVNDNTLSVLTNDGHGGLKFASSPAVGRGPVSVAAGDVNGDASVDLISLNFDDRTLTVLTNNGSGDFALDFSLSVGLGPRSVIANDVNGDGMS